MSTPDNSASYLSNRNQNQNEIKVAQVLVRLGSIYGHLFTSNHKTDEDFQAAVKEWTVNIGHYSYTRLDKAIEKCKLEHKKTITLPEFIECSRVSQYEAMLGRSDPLRLSKLETPEEKSGRMRRGQVALNKIRESMRS